MTADRDMIYDTVSYEVCITEILPDHGAIMGGRPGPIQCRSDFERYPWHEIPDLYWIQANPRFDALCRSLPAGMKAVGGVGNGVFEIAEDLVGFEYLCYLQVDDPKLFEDLFLRIALLGGIDVDLLCREKPDDIVRQVVESGTRFRNNANGYALGSGNSIPDYVPAEGYLALIEAVRKIRELEVVL